MVVFTPAHTALSEPNLLIAEQQSAGPDALRRDDLAGASDASAWCLAYAWVTSFFDCGEGWRGYVELLWALLAARSLTQHLCLAVIQSLLDAASRSREGYI